MGTIIVAIVVVMGLIVAYRLGYTDGSHAEIEKAAWKRLDLLLNSMLKIARLRTALDASNKILRCLNVVQADKEVKREVREQVAANDAALAGKGEVESSEKSHPSPE